MKIEFGITIPGLKIDGKKAPYPVLNERDCRAGAGIMLALGIIAFVLAFFQGAYYFIDIIVVLFFMEFLIRIIDPSIAPFYFLGSLIVREMRPEYSGAAQKRFAWFLGLLMASTMIVLIYGFGIRGPINLLICMTCLFLMWSESAFGVCIGCKMYYGLISLGLIKKPKVAPACPGGVCPVN
jgi:hypothetical protein